MDLLLDTHAVWWIAQDNPRLSGTVRKTLGDTSVRFFVSAVTLFEASELASRKRLGSLDKFASILDSLDATWLDYPALCWQLAVGLPDYHRDPIDRMLIAHAIHADLVLVTADEAMRRYPVKTLW